MRTNIDIDDGLLAETMRISGKKTKKAAVEEAMRVYTRDMIRAAALKDLIELTKGIGWEGDLDEMRRDRTFAEDAPPFDDKT